LRSTPCLDAPPPRRAAAAAAAAAAAGSGAGFARGCRGGRRGLLLGGGRSGRGRLLQQLHVGRWLVLQRRKLLRRQALQLHLPVLRQRGPAEERQELGAHALEEPALGVDGAPVGDLLSEEGMLLHTCDRPTQLRELVREDAHQIQRQIPPAPRGLRWLARQGREMCRPASAPGGAAGETASCGARELLQFRNIGDSWHASWGAR